MSIDKELSNELTIDVVLEKCWTDKSLVKSFFVSFPHLGVLREKLEPNLVLYYGFCPNEDCCYFNQGLEGIVLDIDDDLILGNQFLDNLRGRYILWCCPRCVWVFIERKNSL